MEKVNLLNDMYMGFMVGTPRLPLLKLETKHDKILKEVLEKYKLVTYD